MDSVTAYAAKTHLSSLLERVRQGEVITITKHGTAVAILTPASPFRKYDIKKTISEINEFRKKHTLGGISLKGLIEEGRD